jgi:hypothetical protein
MAKITAINYVGEWNSNYGVLHTSIIVLDDNTSGEVNSKNKDQWKVGDECEYQITGKAPNGNNKLKLSRPEQGGFQQRSAGGSYSPDREKDIVAGMISNQIVQLWGAGVISGAGQVTDQMIQELIDLRNRVKAKL